MKKIIIFLFLSQFILPNIFADTPEVKFLTMEEAITRALGVNNQLRASFYSYKKSQWDYANAWTQLLPSATINSRYTWIDDSSFALRDFRNYLPKEIKDQIPQTVFQQTYATSIDVEMTLFNSAIFNGIGVAKAIEKGAKDSHQSKREQTIFEVVASYLNVLRSQEILELQREYLDLSLKNYEKAERMKAAGRYSQAEALRWKVDYQQQQSLVVSNRSALRSQSTLLKRLLNINMTDSLKTEPAIPEFLEKEGQKIEAMSDRSILELVQLDEKELLQVNASLAALKSGTETSRRLYLNSYGSYLPNVSASFSHAWYENETIDLDGYNPQVLTLNVSMPLFTSFRNLTSIKSSYYDYKEDQENLEDMIQNTRLLLTETANNILNLKTQNALAKTNLELNEHTYRIVESQKDKGLISNLDFIDAKLNLQDAKLNYINTQYDFVSAVIELYYMVGHLESIIEFK